MNQDQLLQAQAETLNFALQKIEQGDIDNSINALSNSISRMNSETALNHVKNIAFAFTLEAEPESCHPFWTTNVGQFCLKAKVIATGDELITISQAAELTGRSKSDLSNMARCGRLSKYTNPSQPNQTHATRLLKSEVLQLPSKRV